MKKKKIQRHLDPNAFATARYGDIAVYNHFPFSKVVIIAKLNKNSCNIIDLILSNSFYFE